MNLNRVVNAVARSEGFRKYVYKDSEGYWTVGHGILVDSRRGGGITRQESRLIMSNRLINFHLRMNRVWPWTKSLSERRQEALVRMGYNLGFKGLRGFKKMLRAMRTGNFKLAADEALDSKWAKQVGSRANRIANLIRQG